MVQGRSSFNILTDKDSGNRSVGKLRHLSEGSIRMDLKGIVVSNWIDSALDKDYWNATVNAALKLRVP